MTPQTNRRTFSNGVLSHGTRTRKVRLLALLASTALAHATVAPAQSLPSGGQVAAGSATIGTPSAGALTINQTSGSAVVNWQSFNVGKANRVTFVQPDANAAILNRVTGEASSTIAGQINANGQVYLINPNGIAITSSGTVKAGAFVASTLGISDDDFMGGKRSFTGNGASAPVTNAGAITINRGGYMALIGGTVANAGVITVPMGKAALGSGEQATLDLSGDGFLQVAVPTKAGGSGALVDNSGKISARGGTVQLTAAAAKDMARQAVNMSGTIEANGVSGKSGDITLTGGDGEVAVSGTLDAGNAAGKGGKVTVTGRSIKLASARVNASGKTGGGTVNIGGNRQGKGPLQHAETLDVDAHTVINADAVTTGTGGDVVLWSDDLTNFAGTITAKGGAISGSGGEAEVSGKAKLSYTGLTDLTAAHGSFGNLLLDPYNVTISTGTGSNTDGGFNATGNDSVINVNTLTNALATANVTVTTGSSSDATNPQAGTITVAAPINWSALTTLTLAAASDININSAITANGGLIVSSGGTISAPADVNVGAFVLAAGNWVQNSGTLPAFSAKDFRITDGASFLRVTGGDGTSATPYTVRDVYGLQGIGSSSDYLSANWKLAGDIDASGTAIWNNGAGLKPIGDDNITFTGRLDGASHTITGLTINRPNTNTVGLFGIIGQGGGVSGLGLVNANVSGRSMTGGLAGSNAGGIVQSYISGSVSGVTHTGGLVGYNTGAINLSYSTASVSGASNVGGLLGMNFGTMNQVYASGAVSGMGNLGGLVGGNIGTVVASYFDMSTTLQSSGVGNGSTSGISGLNSAQARNASNYSGWDFNAYWYQSGDLRPILRSEAAAADANGVVTISNLHQLALMGANLAGNYKLAVDIDAGAAVGTNAADIWSTGGWVPVGTYGAAFTGVFDGAGHTITGLVVNRAASFLGLFGNSAGTIQNIGLVGEAINGYSYTGGLVGYNTGAISNAYTTGTVNGSQDVGGLVGYNSGSISNSYATAAVSGGYEVGGLVGYNHGSISNSYATGAIFGSGSDAGGLAGFNDRTIKFAYATGSVTGNTYVGGLVGYNDSGSSIDNAYASGAVNGSVAVGGLVGRNFYSTITNSFWDVSTTGRSSGYGQSFSGTFSAIGLTTGQARSASSYSGWDFGGVWYQAGDMRPILRSEAATTDSNGVASIWNLHQLALIAANLNGNYTLANDIDASETSGANASGIWSTGGWVPLGNTNTMFRGSFDGNNHTINALTVTGYDQVGLFSVSAGSISNLGLVGGSVAGVRTDVGALAGWNYGTISNSYSTATVSGNFDVGGLVGINYGTISSSHAAGAVSGVTGFMGGLVAYNFGTITNAYANGVVSGSATGAGGLVGLNAAMGVISGAYATGSVSSSSYAVGGLAGSNLGTITNTYASGAVSGSDKVGGLVGGNYGSATISNSYAIGAVSSGGGLIGENDATVTASFWNTETTGQTSGNSGGSSTGMTGLTSAQMADPFSFINAGWDFAGIWGKSTSGANDGYMTLRSLSTGLYDDYVAIGNGTRTYGDSNATITGATLTGVGTGNVSLTWGNAIASTTNAGTYNYSDPDIVSVTEIGPRTAYVDYSGALTISQRVLSLTGGRTYDGSTDVAAGNLTLGNLANGETLTLTGAGSMADKNVGTGKALSLGTLLFSDDTGLASNYVLGTGTVDITKASIASITGITADNKTYDGNANATLNTSSVVFNGMAAGDSLSLGNGVTGAFSGRNAGTGKTVTISGLMLDGTDAGNYTLALDTATTTADINKATISSITGITAAGKTYDGNTSVVLNTSGAGFSGMVGGDVLTVATSTGAFSDKNAGTKVVNISGLTLGGADAGNYTLALDTATTTADIARATISSITGITANNKTYNGNTTAVLNTSGAGFTGMIAGDTLTVATSTGAFSDKNAGTGKTVGITSLTLGGTDASNYTLTSDIATTTADIAKAYVAFGGTSVNTKTYDGTTAATVNIYTIPISGDDMHVGYTSANFSDKNAGMSKTVAIDGLYITGADANNYQLGITNTTSYGTIAPAIISAITGITAGNKTYDGTTNVALNTAGAVFNGMIAGDSLTVGTALGAFSNANAGTGKTVGISGLTLGGADAQNYRLDTSTATTLADIGQRVVNLSGSRTYNGSTDLDASIFTLSNLVGGETLTLSGTGTMADKNAGSGKGVTLASLALGDGTNGGLASNYTLAGGTDAVDIARAMISSIGGITANGKIYDGTTDATLNTAGAVFNGMVSGDALSLGNGFSGAFSDKNAGTGKTVTISGLSLADADAGNYTLAYNTATTLADIAKRAITVTADGVHRTYGDANPRLTYTVGGSGLVNGDTLSGALATSATTASGIGNYGITLGTLANSNYDISFTGANLTVTPRAITVTADAKSKIYGDTNPALTYTTSGLVNNDTLSGSLVTSAGQYSGVGGYGITLGSLGNANYAITYNAANLTVTPRAITVTADAKSKIYGDANPALTYTTSGLVNGDMLSGSLSTAAGQYSNVGGYGITLGGLGNANYAITYNAANLTVTPRVMTVTADAKSKTYGDANPTLTYTTAGLVNGDMLSGSLSTEAGQYSNVGGYGITLGGLGNANYAITYNAANLTITPRALTVTADALSRAYGDANPTLTYTTSGLVNGDMLSGSLSTSAGQYSDVGAYAIAQGTLANANYAISYTGANLTVNPRALTVTAGALSKIYGDANPMLTYTANGLVNGDTLSGSLATTAGQYANVGSFAITGSFSASSNYALTYVGANLSVNRRAITVTADTLSKTYGDANPALTYTVGGAGLVNGDMLSGSLSTMAGQYSNVGSYAITGSFSASSNYALTYVGANLSVNRRAITVTADTLSKTYGDANPMLTYAATGLLNGDTLSGSLSTTAGQYSDVGAYAITQGSLANANYAISYMGADLTVNQRAIAVAADSLSRRYGLANPALTYTVGGAGLVNGDRLSGGLATSATGLSEPGAYAITQGTLLASANYRMNFVPGVLTVEKAANPEPGTQASSVMPSFDAGRFAPIRPVSDNAETADGSHDVITDPRFEGTFVCLDNGNGCVSLPGQATP